MLLRFFLRPCVLVFLISTGFGGFARAETAAWTPPEGRYEIASGPERIEIIRDDYGVPHVYAETFEGVWFGQGYVTAEDRLWQLELNRADARGEFAELGVHLLENGITRDEAFRHDLAARREKMPDAEYEHRLLWIDHDTGVMLRSYCEGVNAFIDRAIADQILPPEYAKLGLQPRHWTVADLLVIGDLLARRLGDANWESAVLLKVRDQFIERHGDHDGMIRFNDLFHYGDTAAPTTEPPEEQSAVGGVPDFRIARDNDLPGGYVDLKLMDQIIGEREEEMRIAEKLGLIADWGSQAWAVDRRRTASETPMFFASWNGSAARTGYFHEVLLNGPAGPASSPRPREGSINARGAAIPGMPGIFIGANAACAWAVTAGRDPVSDYYVEMLSPDEPSRYVFSGMWYDMIERTEQMRIRNRDGSVTELEPISVYTTVHGPLIGFSRVKPQAVSVRRPWWQDRGFCYSRPFLEFARMDSVREFIDACTHFTNSHHAFFADGEDIAYQWSGRFALYERGHDPRLPALGAGTREWVDIVKFDQQPGAVNPRRGVLVNWNTKPGLYWLGWYGRIYWPLPLQRSLEAREPVTWDEFLQSPRVAAEHDFLEPALRGFVELAVEHSSLEGRLLATTAARAMLREEIAAEPMGPARALYATFGKHLIRELFAEELPVVFEEPYTGENLQGEIAQRSLGALMMRVMNPRSRDEPTVDYGRDRTRGAIAAAALMAAVEELSQTRGATLDDWRTEELPTVSYGLVGRLENPGKRATYRQIIEFSDPPKMLNVLRPGQSGAEGTQHANDQQELFEKFEYKPMTLGRPNS